MIQPALISHSTPHGSITARLYRSLAKSPDITPRCWVKHSNNSREEKIGGLHPHIGEMFQRAASKLLGRGESELSFPLAWHTRMIHKTRDCDILHLQRLRGHSLSMRDIAYSPLPVVCELSDLYPISAICAGQEPCEQLSEGCRNCPKCRIPALSRSIFELKQRLLSSIPKLIFVSKNRWMTKLCEQSPIMQGIEHRQIGIPIDSQSLQPSNRARAKQQIGIHPHTRVIGYACPNLEHTHPRRQQEMQDLLLIQRLLSELKSEGTNRIMLLLIGGRSIPPSMSYASVKVACLQGPQQTAELYNACDILIVPSHQGESECVMLEAMSCALPIIAINEGPVEEHLGGGKRGRCVPKGDLAGLLCACRELLQAPILRQHLGLLGRAYIEQQHSEKYVGELYKQLYSEMLHRN